MIEVKHGENLENQSQEFIYWFNEEILTTQKLDFGDTCSERDEFNRPKSWRFENTEVGLLEVEAIYLTEDGNYQFNTFKIN